MNFGSTAIKPSLVLLAGLFLLPLMVGAAKAEGPVRDVSPPWLTRPQRPGAHMFVPNDEPVAASAPRQKIVLAPSGQIKVDGQIIDIPDIRLPLRAQVCIGPSGMRWACGSAAYVNWANLFRSGTVSCAVQPGATACSVRGRRIEEILLTDGWALLTEHANNETLNQIAADAKRLRAGIYGDPPKR